MRSILLAPLWLVFLQGWLPAQVFDERFDDWPLRLKIDGTLVAAESLADPNELSELLDLDQDDKSVRLFANDPQAEALTKTYATALAGIELQGLDKLHISDDDGPSIIGWLDTRRAEQIPAEEVQRLELQFSRLLAQGGKLVVIGPHCRILSQYYILSAEGAQPQVAKGMNLLPDCVLETGFQHHTEFDGEPGDEGRVLSVLATHPRCVGIGLNPQTVLTLDGRKFKVAGAGQAKFILTANERQPYRTQSIAPPAPRQRPSSWLVDLGEWRRDAIERTLEPFPPAEPALPQVDSGTLIIVGGGGMPDDLMERFVELAGGPQEAHLVYIPCAEEDQVAERQGMVESWKRMGVQHATFVHTKDRQQANSDETFLQPLKEATGIWFGGGRQWNFADSYYGTTAHQLMKQVLHRGGVIGGSSAGASIQARYLARATPIENFQIMAPGYERGGLGFLSGVAIDQHFSQRQRQADMTQLVERYPQLLGIGLDEATAIIVQQSRAEVVGRGKVHFYDRRQPVYPDQPDFVALEAGKAYDLAARKPLPAPEQP